MHVLWLECDYELPYMGIKIQLSRFPIRVKFIEIIIVVEEKSCVDTWYVLGCYLIIKAERSSDPETNDCVVDIPCMRTFLQLGMITQTLRLSTELNVKLFKVLCRAEFMQKN